jgi:hypothetical protein
MSAILEWAQLLYDSQFSTALRESQYMFPMIEGLHLLGLAASVGLIVLTDLRLIGVFVRGAPAADVLHQLRPWVLGGFAATFVTGLLLFCASATTLVTSRVFLLKLLLVLLAGVNALWFEIKLGRRSSEWQDVAILPKGVQLAAWMSLVLWAAVVISGRMIPYLG